MSAFACGPNRGSEPGTGWNWVVQAARDHDVWVLVCDECREGIEASREHRENSGINFVFWTVPLWPARRVDPYRNSRFIVLLYYVLWQITVVPIAWRLHRREKFELVHHVTFNTVEVPGFLWLLSAPFVWGPVGGAQLPPRAFSHHFGRSWFGEQVRLVRKFLSPLNPVVRLALRKAHTVLAANADTERLLYRSGAKSVIRQLDAGIYPERISPNESSNDTQRIVALWAGVLTPRKAPVIAIEAVAEARARGVDVELHIAGDGPLSDEVDRRIESLGLDGVVKRYGELSFDEMRAFYRRGDLFLFTSLHDTSGNVVLEAMAHGLPVVTLDHQGAAEMVDAGSGFKVPVTSEREVISGLASALQSLAGDAQLRASLGAGARTRVEREFAWDRRSAVIKRVYDAAIRSRAGTTVESRAVTPVLREGGDG